MTIPPRLTWRETRERLTQKLRAKDVPEILHDALLEWVINGCEPGHFLTAVISNDLQRAVGHADATCVHALKPLVMFLYNDCPAGCHGSPDRLRAWSEAGGLEGRRRARAAAAR